MSPVFNSFFRYFFGFWNDNPTPTTHVGLIFRRKRGGGAGIGYPGSTHVVGGGGGGDSQGSHSQCSGQRSVLVCTSECLVISCCNMEKKIFSDEEVFEQIKPASRKACKK